MATWKPENSMLTARGVEILNKLKAGEGVITITRVVASSGRVNEDALYDQTSVSGIQKEMVLSKKNSREAGSELVVYITNAGLTESFELNQIGVYVTHPDYVGEQLYHISQCDAGTQDIIPTPDVNPVSLIYSLYLEHGNSSSVQITVDPQGMVSREEFENFFKGAVAGNLFTFDEDMNIVDTGVPASMLGSTSRNMVNNWYLKCAVDSKAGNIVDEGTPYYEDTSFTEQAGILDISTEAFHVSGNNYCAIYIDDSEYYVTVNSVRRGYLGKDDFSAVCVDRWKLYNGSSQSRFDYFGNKSSRITLSPGDGKFTQSIASYIPPDYYGGKTYTFSAMMDEVTNGTPVLFVDTGEEIYEATIIGEGLVTLTVNVPENAEDLIVGIRNKHESQASIIEVSAFKFEVGNKSTLENDPPADYAEQAAICIQYDPNEDYYVGFPRTTNTLASASIIEE